MAKKKLSKKQRKNKKQKLIEMKLKTLFWVIVILAISVLVLSIVQFVNLEKIFPSNEKVFIEIKDECTFMQGIGLVHQIKNEDNCQIYCKNRCKIEELEADYVEFTSIENDCNLCNCYCK